VAGVKRGLGGGKGSGPGAPREPGAGLKGEGRHENQENEKERRVSRQHNHFGGFLDLITRQGLPAAITSSGTSSVTTEQAPTILRAPMAIPGMTNARAPTKASSPIVIGPANSGMSGESKS